MKTTSYLPMPLTGARRIESERAEYLDLQRRHHVEHPDYARGWRRPSDTLGLVAGAPGTLGLAAAPASSPRS